MNLINNLDALTQTHFDSGSLGGLAAVVHRLAEAGQHPLTVLQADRPVRTLALVVQDVGAPAAKGPAATPAAGVAATPASSAPAELHVNLSGLGGGLRQPGLRAAGTAAESGADLVVAASGYAVFHAPAGSAGFAVLLHAPGAPDKPPVFDSRQLGDGDAFATTIFRPGRYSLTNSAGNAAGQIRVSYPVIGDTPYQPPDAFHVQLDANGFHPNDIQLMPAQGIVVHVNNTPARITIDLLQPDDGPALGRPPTTGPQAPGGNRPGYRWVKPQPPAKPPA